MTSPARSEITGEAIRTVWYVSVTHEGMHYTVTFSPTPPGVGGRTQGQAGESMKRIRTDYYCDVCHADIEGDGTVEDHTGLQVTA